MTSSIVPPISLLIDLISIFEMQICADEINEYLSKFFELYNYDVCEAWNYVNSAEGIWDDYNNEVDISDDDEINQPIDSRLLDSLIANLKEGLDSFCKQKSKLLKIFYCPYLYNKKLL